MKQCKQCMMTFSEQPAPPVSIKAMCQCGVAFDHTGKHTVLCFTRSEHHNLVTVDQWLPRNALLEVARNAS